MFRSNVSSKFIIERVLVLLLFLYSHLPSVDHRGRTQECSKALVVLLSFYWIKVSQLRFIFVLFINNPIRGNLHTLHCHIL